jgi:NUMOD4 motif-containing protein
MIRKYPNEEFREVTFANPPKLRYAVSNKGRLASFTQSLEEGKVLKGATADGYKVLRYKFRRDENEKAITKYHFIFKLVAENFLPKTSDDQKYVLHLDYVRDHDDIKNLKWATYEEMLAHGKRSPHVKKAKLKLLEHNIKSDGRKLTVTKVMLIKKMLQNPNRTTRLKMIAKQFGVSETHIRRIVSGENWGHIKV